MNILLQVPRRCYSFQKILSPAKEQLARDRLGQFGKGNIEFIKDDLSGLAVITLDHEEKKNALSGRMMVQLSDIVKELHLWKCGKGVIIRAVGDSFCSGGDLTTVKAICSQDDGFVMSSFMQDTLSSFSQLPLVTVTLVNGKALGGGAELTTATDYRIFTGTGEVSFVQGHMGLATGWGGGTRLTRLVGSRIALDLLLTCRRIKYEEAVHLGLADYCVRGGSEFEQARDWLSEKIIHEAEVIQALKGIVVGARDELPFHSLENERKLFVPLWGGPANVAALNRNIKHK